MFQAILQPKIRTQIPFCGVKKHLASNIQSDQTVNSIIIPNNHTITTKITTGISFNGCGKYLAKDIQAKTDNIDLWKFEVKGNTNNPTIGRMIISDNWSGKPEVVKKFLEEVCNNWPNGSKVEFLMGCGGLVKFNWPKSPVEKPDFELLTREAEKTVKNIFDDNLINQLGRITDYISFGVDSCKSPEGNFNAPHVELVCMVDLKNKKIHWTGKSYPFIEQEKGLIKAPLESHFISLNNKNIMVLGCHDLSVYNPRSVKVASKEWRINLQNKLKELSFNYQPEIVLQHPHTTDTPNTWKLSLISLLKELTCVKNFASAGKFYNDDGAKRSSLEKVLDASKKGDTLDLILL